MFSLYGNYKDPSTKKSVGLNIYFDKDIYIKKGYNRLKLGVYVERTQNIYFQLHFRSSMYKTLVKCIVDDEEESTLFDFKLTNNIGIIDGDYINKEIFADIITNKNLFIEKNTAIFQLIPCYFDYDTMPKCNVERDEYEKSKLE